MKTYTLISTYDGNDSLEIEVEDGENPETVALETLGWFMVSDSEDDSENDSEE